jgi:hypothetical protein
LFQSPGGIQPVATTVFSKKYTTEELPKPWPPMDASAILTIKDLKTDTPLKQLDNPVVMQVAKEPAASWAIADDSRMYYLDLVKVPPGTIPPPPRFDLSGPNLLQLHTSQAFTRNVEAAVVSLDGQAISSNLRDDFAKQHFVLPSNLVTVLNAGSEWLLTNAEETYFVTSTVDNAQVTLTMSQLTLSPLAPSEAQAKPSGFLGAILTFLEGIPVIGQVVSFLAQFIVLLLPYALLAALVALLLVVGKYTGVAVRNVVGASGEEIPRAMAISTAVRNVSIALLVANQYYSLGNDFGAIAIILVFYLVSLIVTAHEAVKWGNEAAALPTAGARQSPLVKDSTSAMSV